MRKFYLRPAIHKTNQFRLCSLPFWINLVQKATAATTVLLITRFSYSLRRHLSLSQAYQEIFEQTCRYNIMYIINFTIIITIIYVCFSFLFCVCDSSLLCIIMDALTHMSTLLCYRATTVTTAAVAVDASDTTAMLMHSPQSKQQQQRYW